MIDVILRHGGAIAPDEECFLRSAAEKRAATPFVYEKVFDDSPNLLPQKS